MSIDLTKNMRPTLKACVDELTEVNNKINGEIIRAKAKETSVESAIESETQRATEKENALEQSINTVKNDTSSLTDKVNTHDSTILEVSSKATSNSNTINTITGRVSTAENNIAKEAQRAKTEEQRIANLISTEKTRAEQAERLLQPKLTFDQTPRSHSENPVTSNGIYEAIAAISNKPSIPSFTIKTFGVHYDIDDPWQDNTGSSYPSQVTRLRGAWFKELGCAIIFCLEFKGDLYSVKNQNLPKIILPSYVVPTNTTQYTTCGILVLANNLGASVGYTNLAYAPTNSSSNRQVYLVPNVTNSEYNYLTTPLFIRTV